ncbi:MAG TPA: hypothetical protein VNJ03_05790 [Vicinamibacterales bacterium]|nr:hypothetical protein [Vicinamibacterales bacterium]
MNTMVLLTLISVVAASALFIALAIFLVLILRELEPTGKTGVSFLAKIRMGLRAIEVETSHIPREVTKLNAGLSGVRDGLIVVDGNLARLASAVIKQEAR